MSDAGQKSVLARFTSAAGAAAGPPIDVPLGTSVADLNTLLKQLLDGSVDIDELQAQRYAFYLPDGTELLSGLVEDALAGVSSEKVLALTYKPQSVFYVRPVNRCSASLPGHGEAVLSVSFSADGRLCATGSGDTTVRLWETVTTTPKETLSGHTNWVLALAWAPTADYLASGGMDSKVVIYNLPRDVPPSHQMAPPRILSGHKKWVTSLAWEPTHLRSGSQLRLASGSKDGTIRIWNVLSGRCEKVLTGHIQSVTCVKWAGSGTLFTASQDRTIKCWDPDNGSCKKTLLGHGHWVNTMALSTDYVLRTGPFEPSNSNVSPSNEADAIEKATARYEKTLKEGGGERLVSGSDDFTLQLWDVSILPKAPLMRMTGHQQTVNMVCFSPNQNYIASASFDKSVRVWDGATGKFISVFRQHVAAVYMVAWSADSRLLLSASKDSTLKVIDVARKKLRADLPGHADEVFAVDWSPDGTRVGSGGKDKVVKFWHN